MSHQLLIHCPDGQTKAVPLTGGRISVGRSTSAELSFPEDAGLSRQHFAFENHGGEWAVEDLGSKNGTYVNNLPLKSRLRLSPGDRITAGHLAIVFSPQDKGAVVVFDALDTDRVSSATVVTSLKGVLSDPAMAAEHAGLGAQVEALIRVGQCLSENHPLEKLFPLILDLSVKAVNAQRGVILTLENNELSPMAFRGEGFRISRAVRDRVIDEKCSVLVRDAQMDDAFRSRMSIVEQKVHTMMAVPLQTADRIIGLIYVDSPQVFREFTRDDLNLLTVMANVAAIKIEHARLALVEQAERMLQRDLNQAAQIQAETLPTEAPKVAHADLAGYNAACRTVGGDYYYFNAYPDGKVALSLGDASGKGMPAALMAMALHARVNVLAEQPGDLGDLVVRLNKATCLSCPSNRFITFFFSVLDPATGDLAFANAGHNPPVIVRASGAAEWVEGGGPVLGILPLVRYEEQHTRLEVGDMLVIYSDGITEATNPLDEEFGEDRLLAVLQLHHTAPAAAVVEAVTRAVADFSAGAPPADDITLVVARRTT